MNKNKPNSTPVLKKGNVIMLKTPLSISKTQEHQSRVGIVATVFNTYSRLFVFMGVENDLPVFTTYREPKIFNNIFLPDENNGTPMTLNQITELIEQVWDNRKAFLDQYKVKLGMYRRKGNIIQIVQEAGRIMTVLYMRPFNPGVIFTGSWNRLEWIDTNGDDFIPIPQAKRLTQLIEERTISQH